MRTTIDLPDDLHERARQIARDTSRTLSETVADLMRRGLRDDPDAGVTFSEKNGLLVLHTGRGPITTEDVRALEDED